MATSELVFNVIANTANFQKSMNQVGRTLEKTGKSIGLMGKNLTKLTAPIAAFGALGVKSFLDFDNAMTESLAIMRDVDSVMRDKMVEAAKAVARETKFSAKEAAEAYYFLASAGMSAAQSLEALPAVAKFAQAGAFDLALATDILTDAQTALGLSVKDPIKNLENLTRVSDVLVRASTLANASVEQFGIALINKAAPALATVNKSVEEGAAVLAAFADSGIKGEAAGNALSTMLTMLPRLANENAEAFKALNIAVFDSQGKMRNFADIISDYENATKNATDAQKAQIDSALGLNRQVQAAVKILSGASEKIRNYEKELRIAGGTTDDVAQKQMESFKNQLKLVYNSLIESASIIGEKLIPSLLSLAEMIKNAATWFSGLDETVQSIVISMGVLVTALGPVLLVTGKLITSIGIVVKSLAAKGLALSTLAATGGPIALFAAALVSLVGTALYFKDEISIAFSTVAEVANRVFNVILETAKTFLNVFLHLFGTNIETFTVWWGEQWNEAAEFFSNFGTGLQVVIDSIVSAFTWLRESIAREMNVVFEIVTSGLSNLESLVSRISPSLAESFSGMRQSIEDLKAPLDSLAEKTNDVILSQEEEKKILDELFGPITTVSDAKKELISVLEEESNKTKENVDSNKEETESQKKLSLSSSELSKTLTALAEKKDKTTDASKKLKAAQKLLEEQTKANLKSLEDLSSGIGDVFNAILGKASGFMNELSNVITGTTQGTGGLVSQVLTGLFGDTGALSGVQGPLSQMFQGLEGGASIGSALFGTRPEGLVGPLMEGGQFTPGGESFAGLFTEGGMFAGAGSANAYLSAASGVIQGISKIGQSTVETMTGVGQAAGAAFGAYLGGPVGAMIGEKLGSMVGEGLGKGIKKLFGSGSQNPATLARREFEKQFNNLIDGKNIKIIDEEGVLQEFTNFSVGAKDRWNEIGWADTFQEFAGSAWEAFNGVGIAMGYLLEVGEGIHEQIGAMLFSEIGTIENLGMVLAGLGIPAADFEAALLKALKNGEIGLREYIIALQGLREAFDMAEAATNDVDLAVQMLIQTGGDSIQTLKLFQTVIQAAMNSGITSVNQLIEHLRKQGNLTEEQLKLLADAFARYGITSMEQLASASDEFLVHILTYLTTIAEEGGDNFYDLEKQATKSFQNIANEAEKTAGIIKGQFKNLNFDASVNVNTVPSRLGNVFSSGSVLSFAKGGVVPSFSMFPLASMAEQGPEAILPLDRLPDGRLGVLVADPKDKTGNVYNYHITGSKIDAIAIRKEIEKFNDRKNRAPGRFF